jgi:hypothetical protein
LTSLLKASLFEHAVLSSWRQVIIRLARDGDASGFAFVLVLAVAASLGYEDPTILQQQAQDLWDLHLLRILALAQHPCLGAPSEKSVALRGPRKVWESLGDFGLIVRQEQDGVIDEPDAFWGCGVRRQTEEDAPGRIPRRDGTGSALEVAAGLDRAVVSDDATIIAAPSSTKSAAGERDPEMHQAKKGPLLKSEWVEREAGWGYQGAEVHHRSPRETRVKVGRHAVCRAAERTLDARNQWFTLFDGRETAHLSFPAIETKAVGIHGQGFPIHPLEISQSHNLA